VMGLGKTLTMIATVVSTLGVSRQYSTTSDADKSGRTGATLVVVTSMREFPKHFPSCREQRINIQFFLQIEVLHVWETEIGK
jgi:hypothetical protein